MKPKSPGHKFANAVEDWLVPEGWELDAEAAQLVEQLRRDAGQSVAKMHFYEGLGLVAGSR